MAGRGGRAASSVEAGCQGGGGRGSTVVAGRGCWKQGCRRRWSSLSPSRRTNECLALLECTESCTFFLLILFSFPEISSLELTNTFSLDLVVQEFVLKKLNGRKSYVKNLKCQFKSAYVPKIASYLNCRIILMFLIFCIFLE